MRLRFSIATPTTTNELDFTDDRLVIEEAIRDFSPREREIIELRFVKGMTQIEIAKKLGISQVQVSRLLRRTLKKIQDKIDPDGVMVRSMNEHPQQTEPNAARYPYSDVAHLGRRRLHCHRRRHL